MIKKIAVVLAGCGNQDGTEVTEAVSLWIGLSMAGAEVHFFSPEILFQPKNHLTQSLMSEERSTLIESGRIARGKVLPLADLDETQFDGLAFPGGFGAATRLSTWGTDGVKCEVNPLVRKAIESFYKASKPIAAICIAPVLIAKVLGPKKPTITLGLMGEAAKEAQKTGTIVEECPATDYITDREHKVITSPAYMHDDAKPHEVFQGIVGLSKELVEWA